MVNATRTSANVTKIGYTVPIYVHVVGVVGSRKMRKLELKRKMAKIAK